MTVMICSSVVHRGQNEKCKGKVLRLQQNLSVIKDIERTLLCTVIPDKHGISIGQVSDMKKRGEYQGIRYHSHLAINESVT